MGAFIISQNKYPEIYYEQQGKTKDGKDKNSSSLRQDGYATRSCPPLRRCDRKNEKQTKTNNKQTKTESTTKNRLATHQDKQDTWLRIRIQRRKKRKTNHIKITFGVAEQFAVEYAA